MTTKSFVSRSERIQTNKYDLGPGKKTGHCTIPDHFECRSVLCRNLVKANR